MDQEKIGRFLQANRKEKGLTQEQLAEKLGVSQKAVSRWETGKNMPDIALLPEICRALDLNIAELLNGERYEGDVIEKKKVSAIADGMVSLVGRRRFLRNLIGAVLAFVLTIACMYGVYSREFNVRVDSTLSLEAALSSYLPEDPLAGESKPDLLESTFAGRRLIVLFEYVDREPGSRGIAILERGLFGKYRFCTVYRREGFGIFDFQEELGGQSYLIAACADELPEYVAGYGILGFDTGRKEPIDYDDPQVVYRAPYSRSPFLTVEELRDGLSVTYRAVYFDEAGNAYDILDIYEDLGLPYEGSSSSSTSSMEPGLVYWLEAIVLGLGIIFIRFFLLGAFPENRIGKSRR